MARQPLDIWLQHVCDERTGSNGFKRVASSKAERRNPARRRPITGPDSAMAL